MKPYPYEPTTLFFAYEWKKACVFAVFVCTGISRYMCLYRLKTLRRFIYLFIIKVDRFFCLGMWYVLCIDIEGFYHGEEQRLFDIYGKNDFK